MTLARLPIAPALFIILTACGSGGGDDSTTRACERWDAIQGTQTSDADAAAELNEIADLSTNTNVSDKAEALAIALEGQVTQTEIGQRYEAMDAACQAAT